MLLSLFSILWGILVCLILSSPLGYYPLFISMFIVSIAVYMVAKKIINQNKRLIAVNVVCFFTAYILCSYFIFKPSTNNYFIFSNVSKEKKAVIFYCEGEMEKYTPYYSGYFINNKPFYLKPLYSYQIKKIYSEMELNNKNQTLNLIARDVKSSILSYKPYFFYIAYSAYTPTINDALSSAVNDGCSEIFIINYSSNNNLLNDLSKTINFKMFENNGVKISVTKSIQQKGEFQEYMANRIINMPSKFDGIVIVTKNEDVGTAVKSIINETYKKDDMILITNNLEDGIKSFIDKGANNILYICLDESSSGLTSEYFYPKTLLKYTNKANIVGIKDWGYDRALVKATIKSFLEIENNKWGCSTN